MCMRVHEDMETRAEPIGWTVVLGQCATATLW